MTMTANRVVALCEQAVHYLREDLSLIEAGSMEIHLFGHDVTNEHAVRFFHAFKKLSTAAAAAATASDISFPRRSISVPRQRYRDCRLNPSRPGTDPLARLLKNSRFESKISESICGGSNMSPGDVAYFRKRALEERARANTATKPYVARVHAELAKRYEALIRRPVLRIWSKDRSPP